MGLQPKPVFILFLYQYVRLKSFLVLLSKASASLIFFQKKYKVSKTKNQPTLKLLYFRLAYDFCLQLFDARNSASLKSASDNTGSPSGCKPKYYRAFANGRPTLQYLNHKSSQRGSSRGVAPLTRVLRFVVFGERVKSLQPISHKVASLGVRRI